MSITFISDAHLLKQRKIALFRKLLLLWWDYQPQTKPCFPAASNALALPGGNGIFRATPTERITHYTLLRKVVCQMGRCPLWKPPQQTGAMHPAGSIAPFVVSSPFHGLRVVPCKLT